MEMLTLRIIWWGFRKLSCNVIGILWASNMKATFYTFYNEFNQEGYFLSAGEVIRDLEFIFVSFHNPSQL